MQSCSDLAGVPMIVNEMIRIKKYIEIAERQTVEGFPLILPRYLMAVNFTAFDLAAYI